MDANAGVVIEKGSEAGREIMKLMQGLKAKGSLEDDIRLHQERGVYNVSMKLPADKAKGLEAIPAHAFQVAGQEEQFGGGSRSSGIFQPGGPRQACL